MRPTVAEEPLAGPQARLASRHTETCSYLRRFGSSTFTCAKVLKNLAHVNVLGQEIACSAVLHLARMIGRELFEDHFVRPRDCNEANSHLRARLRGCNNVAGALCPKIPCDRSEMRSAKSGCRISSNLITTVLEARQDSAGRITRARRTYVHIWTHSFAHARAVKTQTRISFWHQIFTTASVHGMSCSFFERNIYRRTPENPTNKHVFSVSNELISFVVSRIHLE